MSLAPVPPSLSREQLRSVFEASGDDELVGIEVETAALDPLTGAAVPYHGETGIRAYLEFLSSLPGAGPELDRGILVGARLADGGTVSLEHGGAVEFSSRPATCVADLAQDTVRSLGELADHAARFGFALVPGAHFPCTSFEEVNWIPHARAAPMRRHFESLGAEGSWGPRIMSMTLSTQASFDFTSGADLAAKLTMQAAASTPAAALFVNAPMHAGRPSGFLSHRMRYWSRTDPARTRVVPVTLREDFDLDLFIDWALTLPMIHRAAPDGGRQGVEPVPFGTLLSTGFADGTSPDMGDWNAHLSQIFPDVRLRDTLEVRAVDGPPWPALMAVPAFWSGLTYHQPSRDAAWELLRHTEHDRHLAALDDIARRGMAAHFDGRPVRETATELLRLSAEGLSARVDAGLERAEALACLDPLHEVAASGTTFAEHVLAAWREGPARFPARFVADNRIT